MDEASARDGFATNMSRESIVAGLRAVRAEAVSRANSDAGWALNIDRQGGARDERVAGYLLRDEVQ